MKTIAFVNQKGGVGKTTTALNVAGFMALRGKQVLLVDLDPQGNATTGIGLDRNEITVGTYEVIVEGAPLERTIMETEIPGLRVLPANRNLPGCEIELTPMIARELRLRKAIEHCGEYFDFILIDCPPSLGPLTLNGLVAADSLIIPIQAEFYALEGLSQLLQTFHLVTANLNPDLTIQGILMTMFDGRTNLAREVQAEVENFFAGREKVFETKIPRNIRLAEAPSHGKPISHYAPGSLGAMAYSDLTEEILSAFEPEYVPPPEPHVELLKEPPLGQPPEEPKITEL